MTADPADTERPSEASLPAEAGDALPPGVDPDRALPGRRRLCALTRTVRPEAELVRFVAAPDGTVVADLRARLPGRGMWLGLDRAAVGEATRRKVFARALKRPVTATADLADQIAARLREAALGRLGLARKAGGVVAGFAKTESAVAGGTLLALLIASDAAEDGRRKMNAAVARRFRDDDQPLRIGLFTADELSLALGSPNVIHAAVLQGPSGRSFTEAVVRLLRYEGAGGDLPFRDAANADRPQDM